MQTQKIKRDLLEGTGTCQEPTVRSRTIITNKGDLKTSKNELQKHFIQFLFSYVNACVKNPNSGKNE